MDRTTLLGLLILVGGAIVLFYVAKATVPFILDHWILILLAAATILFFAIRRASQ